MTSEDFKSNGMWVQNFRVGGEKVFTKMGRMWNSMTARCKVGGSHQRTNPAYIGCTYSFVDFQDFADWCVQQVGYGPDCVLDKDILVKGNSVYGRDTCALVPRDVNNILTGRKPQRGSTSTGVHYVVRLGKYRAALSMFGSNRHLGMYPTEGAAFVAYKTAKEAYIKQVAEVYRGKVDIRVTEALMSYEVTSDGS